MSWQPRIWPAGSPSTPTGMADAPLPERRRKRFSLSGTIGFERRVFTDQERIATQVQALVPPDHFRAFYLCGTYGRGEGVRLRDGDGREIADRYQYALIVGRTDPRLRAAIRTALSHLGALVSDRVRIPLEVRLIREERLYPDQLSLPLAELRWGGRLLRGNPAAVQRMTPAPFEHLAPGELLWQMVEQGKGLLRNQALLLQGTDLSDDEKTLFFRNLIDAVLICGDLRLAVAGRYHPAHREKLKRLEALDQLHQRKFLILYQIAHQAYPDMDASLFSGAHLLDWQSRCVWLWLDALRRFERWRVRRVIAAWESYCRPGDKGQGGQGSLTRHFYANWAMLGRAGLQSQPLWFLRDPRERLIGAMPLLISRPQTTPPPAVAAALALPAGTGWRETIDAFLAHCRRWHDLTTG